MADIEKKVSEILNDTKNQSLSSRMGSLKEKIQLASKYKSLTLLCDVSGSMDAYVGQNHEAKAIDVVNALVNDFPGARVFEFGSHCQQVPPNVEMRTKGSTNLAGAFKIVKSHGINEIMLLTDGEPDSEEAALREAQGLKINIIYIGPAPTPLFLKKLGGIVGNSFDSVDLLHQGKAAQKEIATKIKGLLGA